jgi:hypothetical protein
MRGVWGVVATARNTERTDRGLRVLMQVRVVLRRLGERAGLGVDELLAAYRGVVMSQLGSTAALWGAFDTAALLLLTEMAGHPTMCDVEQLVGLVLRVLPVLPPVPAARLLSALYCLQLTATPLQTETATALLALLFPRLQVLRIPVGDVPPSGASDSTSLLDAASDDGVADFPALEVLRIVVDHSLVGEAELRTALVGPEQRGMSALLGCLEVGQARLRSTACVVLQRLLDMYDVVALVGQADAEAVRAAVARRVDDSRGSIRRAALALTATLTPALRPVMLANAASDAAAGAPGCGRPA